MISCLGVRKERIGHNQCNDATARSQPILLGQPGSQENRAELGAVAEGNHLFVVDQFVTMRRSNCGLTVTR